MPNGDGTGPIRRGNDVGQNRNEGCRRQGGQGRGQGYGCGQRSGSGRGQRRGQGLGRKDNTTNND